MRLDRPVESKGNMFSGEIVPEMRKLIDKGIFRVVDVGFTKVVEKRTVPLN